MSAKATPAEILSEAKLLYSKLTPKRRPWDKVSQPTKLEKYLQIAEFTANREKAHHEKPLETI